MSASQVCRIGSFIDNNKNSGTNFFIHKKHIVNAKQLECARLQKLLAALVNTWVAPPSPPLRYNDIHESLESFRDLADLLESELQEEQLLLRTLYCADKYVHTSGTRGTLVGAKQVRTLLLVSALVTIKFWHDEPPFLADMREAIEAVTEISHEQLCAEEWLFLSTIDFGVFVCNKDLQMWRQSVETLT